MHTRLLPLLAAVVLVAGCASQSDGPDAGLSAATPPPSPPPSAASIAAAPGGYKLTPAEEKLDCAKLTGQMKVRIASMRANFASRSGSDTSRVIQGAVTPIYGGTKRGASVEGDLANDRAKLEAFNRRLAEKKCKVLDLDAELRGEAPAAPAKDAPKRSG